MTTLRPTDYALQVTTDGSTWHTVATVGGRQDRTTDSVSFAPVSASAVRVVVRSAPKKVLPMLEELSVS